MREIIKNILIELYDHQNWLLIEGKATVNVPTIIDNEIESYISKVNGKNGFMGYFLDKEDKIRSKSFKIESSLHYKQRLFRTKEPEYLLNGRLYDKNIIDPKINEGVDLIMNNINRIAELINNGIIKINNNPYILYSKTNPIVGVIVSFSHDSLSKRLIIIKLITQIKGVKFSQSNTRYGSNPVVGLDVDDTSLVGQYAKRLVERIKLKMGLTT
jgi:hypothetical protein